MSEDSIEKDKFGLPYLTTTQEVAVSFTLLSAGLILVLSTLATLSGHVDLGPAMLGTLMMVTAYLFLVESVRELEEKDHFLSEKLGK